MKQLIIFIILTLSILLIFSCSSTRLLPDAQLQASLVSYNRTSGLSAEIIGITRKTDTVYLLYRWRGMGAVHFFRGMKFTARYRTDNFRVINGRRYYPAMITVNN